MHSHYVLEIYIALESSFHMDFGKGSNKYQSIIINSNVPHRFSADNGTCALILINPNHNLANKLLNNILIGDSFKKLDLIPFQDILLKFSSFHGQPITCDYAGQLVAGLLKGLTKDFSKISRVDPRIKKVISLIHSSYKDSIRLSHLASLSNLSESRLRHLFKKETGITIRQYILNMRVTEAVKLVIDGFSKTYAAIETGFSDSAHLSRTFRIIYGLTLTDLYKYRQNENIHYCPKTVAE